MNAKALFSAGIRILGLWYLAARGVYDLLYFFVVYTGLKTVSVSAELPYTELVYGLFFSFLGLYLLRGAPLIVDYAFPYKETETEDEIEEKGKENIIENKEDSN